jgi:hypothetical protein
MDPVMEGSRRGFTARLREGPFPQVLDGTTTTEPPVFPTVVDIAFVPCPELRVQPEGRDQVYVIPATGITE